MVRAPALVLAALVGSVVLAGCVTDGRPPRWEGMYADSVLRANECPPSFGTCVWSQGDEGWSLALGDADLGRLEPSQVFIQSPVRSLSLSNVTLRAASHAVLVTCDGCDVELRDVHVIQTAKGHTGIEVRDGGRLRMDNVTVEGGGIALILFFEEVEARGVRVQDTGGALLHAATRIRVEGLVATRVLGGVGVLGTNILLANSSATEGFLGFSVGGWGRAAADAVVRDVVVTGNTWRGMRLSAATGRVESSRFEGNGLDGSTPPVRGGLVLDAYDGSPRYTIRDSVFAGNGMYGVYGADMLPGGTDAANNYWGSPLGPSTDPTLAEALDVPQPFGDAVDTGVVYMPFRTAPPSGLPTRPQP